MNGPARKLGKSAVNNIVRFPSIKSNGGKAILVESILESKFCLHLEFDSNVKSYSPQPKTFHLPDGCIQHSYTPDFYVQYHTRSSCYFEIKPSQFANTEQYQQLFSQVESLLAKQNLRFAVVDENVIFREPLRANMERLYQYRKRPLFDMSNLEICAYKVRKPVLLSSLIETLGDQAQLREIYTWLALGYLRFDMDKESLSLATEVTFNVE